MRWVGAVGHKIIDCRWLSSTVYRGRKIIVEKTEAELAEVARWQAAMRAERRFIARSLFPARADAGERTDALFVLGEFGSLAGINHTSIVEHVGAIGDFDRGTHVLFDQ